MIFIESKMLVFSKSYKFNMWHSEKWVLNSCVFFYSMLELFCNTTSKDMDDIDLFGKKYQKKRNY